MFKNISKFIRTATAVVVAAVVAASALACYQPPNGDNGNTPANSTKPLTVNSDTPADTEKTTSAPLDTIEPIKEGEGWTSEYFRIGYSESAAKKPAVVINTAEEMAARFENVAGDKTGDKELHAFIEKCDEEFFKTHFVITFEQTFSSGSIVPTVKSVEVENGKLLITVGGTMAGDVGTDDMATHQCLLVLDRGAFSPELPITVTGIGYYGDVDEVR
ncbi:MAG: hypothetical protein IKS90_06335 [Clostridia bacterium]|nr:hypothetical protein [Clostridia bacterium]